MSIDLTMELTRPISLWPLLPKMADVLAEMLGITSQLRLTLDVLEHGQRVAAETGELRNGATALFLVSISGEPETVGLAIVGSNLVVTMAAQRTNLEYALGAAVAIQLARELGVSIGDDWRFYGGQVRKSADALFETLKVLRLGNDLREAAEQLAGRIDSVS